MYKIKTPLPISRVQRCFSMFWGLPRPLCRRKFRPNKLKTPLQHASLVLHTYKTMFFIFPMTDLQLFEDNYHALPVLIFTNWIKISIRNSKVQVSENRVTLNWKFLYFGKIQKFGLTSEKENQADVLDQRKR